MKTKNLNYEILALFEEEMELEIPSTSLNLMESGYMDSLRFVHLLAVLEEKYDMKISVEDLEYEYFKSVEKIAEFIQTRMLTNSNS